MRVVASKDKGRQIGIRLTESDLGTLEAIIERVVERSNGLAKPDLSSIVRELAHLRPDHYVTAADREFVKSRMEITHGKNGRLRRTGRARGRAA